MGPFERQTLIVMLNKGKLRMNDEVSTDKVVWQSAQTALGLIVPEKAEPKAKDHAAPAPPPPEYPQPMPPNFSVAADDDVEDFPEKIGFGDILLNVIASLGNGGGYLHRLNQYNGNTMLAAAACAAALSLLFGLFGCLIFGSCYNISKLALCIRCLIAILLSGALFWLGNTMLRMIATQKREENAAEADFLSAMHGMMNIGVISILLNGTLFIFNKNLFSMSGPKICAVITVALLPLIFFSSNIILSLRMNLMGNCKLRPGAASLLAVLGFYAVTVLSVLLLYGIYRLS